MRLAVSLVDPDTSFSELVDLAERAEELGYDSLWTNESAAREAFVTLTAWAGRTRRAVLATGVVPVYVRPPLTAAMAAATLSQAAGPERVVLGVGAGHPAMGRTFFGSGPGSPLAAVGDYVTTVRRLLRGERLSGDDGDGARLAIRPSGEVPVVVAALGPRMVEVAAAVGDGVLLNWISPAALAAAAGELRAAAGQRPFRIAAYVRVAVDPDPARAAEALRRELAGYLRLPAYRRHLARQGHGDAAATVAEAWERHGEAEAVAALPFEVVDELGVAGDAQVCRRLLDRYGDSGVDELVVRPVPVGDGGLLPALEALGGTGTE